MQTKPPDWQFGDAHHLGLTVRDLERSLAFYRDVLGFHLVRRRTTAADYLGRQTGFPGVRLKVASLRVTPESSLSLELVEYETHAGAPLEAATNRAGCSHLCVTVDDIHAAYDALRARGARFKTPPVAISSGPNQGGFAVYLYDPDGYTIELFQPSARPTGKRLPKQLACSGDGEW
jgi:catechol 2,3-dioxygenase-like lactoylglutathione lyase family enzyme